MKKNLRPLQLATEESIRDSKAAVVKDLEKRLHLREEIFPHGPQVKALPTIQMCDSFKAKTQPLLGNGCTCKTPYIGRGPPAKTSLHVTLFQGSCDIVLALQAGVLEEIFMDEILANFSRSAGETPI